MAMHYNRYGLEMNGFRLVAHYYCISKGEPRLNIDCYTNGTEYIVRHWRTGKRAWDSVYTDKEEANLKVKDFFERYSFHKRVF